ncbi:Bifunctional oligoribonuclease and PAP phosphatase NrnA [bioreactor metagenome]|uniref:Bifunctional oligoribonuclease and PAP phosphatase NrnA n=1 Tax=bioreactor metagenome TaxID=1076179 RepID=A0A645C3A6_9ZZZZ
MIKVDENKAAHLLLEHDDILILSHAHPDGDTLGCGFGLLRTLLKIGKRAQLLCSDVIPKKFDYMSEGLKAPVVSDPAFIVSVDVADIKLLGSHFETEYKDKINLAIDHHGSNKMQADYLLLDAAAAATCEILFNIINNMQVSIDEKIADCLFTGLSTDTGCFRYYNVTARTHKIAAEMLEKGARAGFINQLMFETKTATYVALEKLAMDTMERYFDDRCEMIAVTQEMFEISGSDESECDPLAPKTKQVEGVLIGVVLREKEDGSFKVSVRTNDPMNAAEICGLLGGGGHKNAAGCQLDGPLEEAKTTILKVIGEYIDDRADLLRQAE